MSTIADAPGWGDAVKGALRRWPGLFDRADFDHVGIILFPPVAPRVRFTVDGVGVLAFVGALIRAGVREFALDAAGGGITGRTVATVRVGTFTAAVGALAAMSGTRAPTAAHRAVVATLDALEREGGGLLRDAIGTAAVMPDA